MRSKMFFLLKREAFLFIVDIRKAFLFIVDIKEARFVQKFSLSKFLILDRFCIFSFTLGFFIKIFLFIFFFFLEEQKVIHHLLEYSPCLLHFYSNSETFSFHFNTNTLFIINSMTNSLQLMLNFVINFSTIIKR